jgi:hypothetical protein
MPLDPAERAALQAAAQQLDAARQQLGTVLGGLPAAPAEQTIDILQMTYGEISNYDRHYSTVRSALTTLVVGAGLVAAAEPIKALTASSVCKDCVTLWCHVHRIGAAVTGPFGLTWLLFVLAVLVSQYFQRLTYACRVLEEEIERRIATAANLANDAPQQVMGIDINGFQFRSDLKAVVSKVSPVYFDEMSRLLVTAILVFFGFLILYALRLCAPTFRAYLVVRIARRYPSACLWRHRPDAVHRQKGTMNDQYRMGGVPR